MKSNLQVDDALGDQSDSQLLKLGWAALKRTNSEDSTKQLSSTRRTTLNPVMSPDPKCPFNLVVSFMLYFSGRSGGGVGVCVCRDISYTWGAAARSIEMLTRHFGAKSRNKS